MKHFSPLSALALCLGISFGASAQGNLVVNGGFDVPTRSSFPGNIANVSSPLGLSADLPDWSAANQATPDYYTTMSPWNTATSPASYYPNHPSGSFFGPFSSYGVMPNAPIYYGCLGLMTYKASSDGAAYMDGGLKYSEYANGILTEPLSGEYYATMQVYKAGGGPVNSATYIGMRFDNSGNPSLNGYTNYSTTIRDAFASSALFTADNSFASLQSDGPITLSQWTHIGKMVTAKGGENRVKIGNFQQSTPTVANALAYQYIDEVGVYKIPTAGPPVSVCNSSVTIGSTPLTIPGATYAWEKDGVVVPGAITPQISVSAAGVYKLIVTLPTTPSTTIRTSSVTVTTSTPPAPTISVGTPSCDGTVNYTVSNYNSNYTYGAEAYTGVTPVYIYSSGAFSVTVKLNDVKQAGSFVVTVTGCGGTTRFTQTVAPANSTPASGYFTSPEYKDSNNPTYPNNSNNRLITVQDFSCLTLNGTNIQVVLDAASTYNVTTTTGFVVRPTPTTPDPIIPTTITGSGSNRISFNLKTNQVVNIKVTGSGPSGCVAGNYVFRALPAGYPYPSCSGNRGSVTSSTSSTGNSVSPNPVSTTLVVTAERADSQGEYEVSLYDSLGKKVKTQRSSKASVEIDVRDLAEGLYTVRSGTGKTAFSRLVQVTH